jgi:lipoyl(octanoyl) transferase
VGYPIVDLKRARLKVPAFVDLLGGALQTLVQEQGVQGALYDRRQPGVYVEGQKLAAIGLHISRGVSTHGFALNVGCDLAGFEAIVPCGLRGVSATTLERALDRDLDPLLIEERIGVLIGQALGATPGPPP